MNCPDEHFAVYCALNEAHFTLNTGPMHAVRAIDDALPNPAALILLLLHHAFFFFLFFCICTVLWEHVDEPLVKCYKQGGKHN